MKADAEFWRNIAPIADVFKPDAKPEVHIPNTAALRRHGPRDLLV